MGTKRSERRLVRRVLAERDRVAGVAEDMELAAYRGMARGLISYIEHRTSDGHTETGPMSNGDLRRMLRELVHDAFSAERVAARRGAAVRRSK